MTDPVSAAQAEATVRTLIRWAGDNPDREGLRGVNVPGAKLTTSSLLGVVRDDPRTREEFLRLSR